MQGKAIQSQHDLAGDPKNKFSNDDNNILVKELVGAKIWTTMKNFQSPHVLEHFSEI